MPMFLRLQLVGRVVAGLLMGCLCLVPGHLPVASGWGRWDRTVSARLVALFGAPPLSKLVQNSKFN